jgi:DNA-binding transcriptional ArsR family regulator
MTVSDLRLADEGLRRIRGEPAPPPERVLEALGDADCRCLLRAVSAEPMTAKGLSAACELPLSTTYRKLDTLREAALVEERTRISTDGRHASEFAPAFDRISVERGPEGSLELGLDPAEE